MTGSVSKYLTEAGKERWRARWDIPTGPDGTRRQRQRKGFATKRDADRFLRERLAELDGGLVDAHDKVTVAEFLTRWLDTKRLRPTTRDNYRTALLVHVIPRIGGLTLVELDHQRLDVLYRDLERHGKAAGDCRTAGITCHRHGCRRERHDGLSTKSVQLVHGAIRAALQDAVRTGRLMRNAADLAQPPKRTAAQRRVMRTQIWNEEEARTFLSATGNDDLAALWALALATGMRRAELVGLSWKAVDLAAGALEVHQTVTEVRGHAVPSLGKTSAAHRRIVLDEPLPYLLRTHQARQTIRNGTAGPDEPVFTDTRGRPLHPGRLTRRFQALAREHGLPPIGMHGLRHTAATLMLNNGVQVHLVANRLGHTDAATTLSVYVHVMPNDDRLAARAISSVLFGRAS